ncbi:MAG: MgtC/SapB family protein [Phycisphaerae bacterium]|nr:MgtC/SapB family protein [Phycisphaerae bacterium]
MVWPGDVFGIVLAVVLGAAIGVEREFSGKAAGLRTNILICLGAAVFTIISKRMAGENDSLTRIAAGVVTGVGFLGAGAIIQDRGGVHGLTTAATIWFMACLGMACGAGLYELAVISTLIAVFVLIGLRLIHRSLSHYMDKNKPKDVSDEPD